MATKAKTDAIKKAYISSLKAIHLLPALDVMNALV